MSGWWIARSAAVTGLSLALALASVSARAVDLDELVEAWTQSVAGAGGTDGVDAALGAAIDINHDVVAVGYVDAEADRGTNGYAVAYAPGGTLAWDLTLAAGPIGTDRTSSDDRYAAVAIDPVTDGVALCGATGPADLDDPATRYLVEARLPVVGYAPYVDWSLAYVAGATSPQQSCLGIAWTGAWVAATGTADHGDDVGAWVSWLFDAAEGSAQFPTLFYDYAQFEAVPDEGHGVGIHSGTGAFAVVGARGFAGLAGSDMNDTDWHVQYFDVDGNLLWSDTYRGNADLDDQAMAVVIDPVTQDVYVVGHTNGGTNNRDGADFDWLMIRYGHEGDGSGGPYRVWERTWESAAGASEGATAITLDEAGDPLVGGWQIDAGTGVERWRVAKLSAYDGADAQEWLGPARAGDSRVHGVAFRDNYLAVAGDIDDGAGPDFALTLLDEDIDEDGVADAVDACPDDPEKAADTGICGCNVPDVDTDGDSVQNCLEDCPTDPYKTDPGVCGCEEPDDDTDGDGTLDCEDRCPTDPLKFDSVGVCGCDVPDTDTDGDGVLGCDDACNNTPPGTAVDPFGCPLEATDTTTGDTGAAPPPTTSDKGGCGCTAAPAPAVGVMGALGLLLAVRRSRRR